MKQNCWNKGNLYILLRANCKQANLSEFRLTKVPFSLTEVVWKCKILQRMYGLISAFATKKSCSFESLYLLKYCTQRAKTFRDYFYFHVLLILILHAPYSYIAWDLLWGKLYANEAKCKQWHQQRSAYREGGDEVGEKCGDGPLSVFVSTLHPQLD